MPDRRTPTESDLLPVYERYRSVIEDWDAFVAALRRRLPTVVWAHPERIDGPTLARLLAEDGVRTEAVPWEPSALRLPETDRPGRHWAHAAGLYHVQEEASLVPATLLDAQPGERVLDLCAAPGGKTARIAFALGNRGTVIANDRSSGRLAATSSMIARLGLRNVTCTNMDGAVFPLDAGPFDKVLVDAPCSAEGTAHKSGSWRRDKAKFRGWIPGLQATLLERALRLCRPGGRVVYSTCTLAPEENEAVIDAVIGRAAGGVRVLPVAPIEGLALRPGLLAWEGARYADEVGHAVRLWPGTGSTGGFFVAVLEKSRSAAPEDAAEASSAIEELAIDASAHPVLARFRERFGLPEDVFAGQRVLEWGRFARLVANDHRVPPPRAKHVSSGLIVTRNRVDGPKLSTGAGMVLGRHATRCVVQLSPERAAPFLRRAPLTLAPEELVACEGNGYVVVRIGAHCIGLGRVTEEDGQRMLVSEFPKAWAL